MPALNKNSIDTLVELAIVPRHLILSNNNVPKWSVTRYRGGSRCSRPFGKNRSIPPSRKRLRPQLSGFFIPRFQKSRLAANNGAGTRVQSRPWGPTERRSGPVRNGRWIRAGNGERVRKKRRSPIVVRHSRRPFSVHCLAFISCTYTPRLQCDRLRLPAFSALRLFTNP